jgi:hypothetical protein
MSLMNIETKIFHDMTVGIPMISYSESSFLRLQDGLQDQAVQQRHPHTGRPARGPLDEQQMAVPMRIPVRSCRYMARQ